MEHIDSNSTKELTDIKEQKEWLKDMLLDISDDKSYKDILQRIKAFIQQDKTDDFNNIREELEKPEKRRLPLLIDYKRTMEMEKKRI